ncbi:pentapeptide repeat-containing protein [Nonomuraea sp. JJY05]|uniref:pentapeptide repeat-containing protein n=1 Tax=Nonomuraea sp. JJY05 TaxID=3350255 RepID=UPI00373EA109
MRSSSVPGRRRVIRRMAAAGRVRPAERRCSLRGCSLRGCSLRECSLDGVHWAAFIGRWRRRLWRVPRR